MNVVRDLDCAYVDEHDLVSLYVSNRLSGSDAEAFERHYFGCDRCWKQVHQATKIRAALNRSDRSYPLVGKRARRSASWAILAAAAAVGAIAILVAIASTRWQPTRIRRELRAAIGDRLPFDVRLTGPLGSLLPGGTRGASTSRNRDVEYLAAQAARDAKRNSSSPEALHTSGLAHLLTGQLDQQDEAVSDLYDASRLRPEDADLLADLSGAYIVRGRQRSTPADFRAAFEAAERARAIKPHSLAALFNRALAFEQMNPGDRERAISLWAEYLAEDRSPELNDGRSLNWRSLAKIHQDRLRKRVSKSFEAEKGNLLVAAVSGDASIVGKITSVYPQESRVFVEEELLPDWGRQALIQPSTASRAAAAARVIAGSLAEQTGDLLLRDSVRVITRTPRSYPRYERLAAGHRMYGEARRFSKERDIGSSFASFRAAVQELAAGASPFRARAALELAGCWFNRNEADQAIKAVEELRNHEREHEGDYLSFFARLDWLAGLVQLGRGYPYEALQAYERSLARFSRISEVENIAALHTLMGECLGYLGEIKEAWRHRETALALLATLDRPSWAPQALGEAARAALKDGHPHVAVRYFEQQLEIARSTGNPVLAADALRSLSLTHERAGDRGLAAHDLQEAVLATHQIRDPSLRQRSLADVEESDGRLRSVADPVAAIQALTAAIHFFDRTNNHFRLAEACLARGDIFLLRKSDNAARADFERGIRELEIQRERVLSDDLKISYFETSERLFDREIQLLAERADAITSLELAERARARVLLDKVQADVDYLGSTYFTEPADAHRLAELLPPELTVIEYRVLPKILCAWVLKKGSVNLDLVEVDSTTLRKQVGELIDSAKAGTGKFQRRSAEISKLLLRPLERWIRPRAPIVFVADKFLDGIPFAALTDVDGSTFLVERHAVSVAPSISVLVSCLAKERAFSPAAGNSILAVGNPRFDRRLGAGLSDLASAETEVRQAAALYENADVILREEATKRRVLALARNHTVLHFSSHALVNSDLPSSSALLLAPDPSGDDTGALYAHEISAARFPQTRLAVLSGCQTGRGKALANEGTMSLARAFLSAGVPEVVATLWDVDDVEAARFDVAFHRAFCQLRSGPLALQAAQLRMLSSRRQDSRSVAGWAAFELMGVDARASGGFNETSPHTTARLSASRYQSTSRGAATE